MTNELKAAAEKRVREIADATGWSGDMRANMTTVVGALRCAVKMLDEERAARLATDEQREFERSRLLSLLREVLACGVSYEGRPYVELQVHRTLLADILTALQDAEKGDT